MAANPSSRVSCLTWALIFHLVLQSPSFSEFSMLRPQPQDGASQTLTPDLNLSHYQGETVVYLSEVKNPISSSKLKFKGLE